MTEIPFAAPAASSGFEMKDHLGHLVVIDVTKLEEGIVTANGTRDAIRGTVHDITLGETFEDTLIWGKVLIGSLSSRIGQRVLAEIGQGNAKPGQNAPWVLVDMSGNPGAVKDATAYLTGQVAKTLAPPAPAAMPADHAMAPATTATVPVPDLSALTPEQLAAIQGLLGAK